MTPNTQLMTVGILGSGAGTTAKAVLEYQKAHPDCSFQVRIVISDREEAGILDVARHHHVAAQVVNSGSPEEMASQMIASLHEHSVHVLVLAGFMKLLPQLVIDAMNGRVVNVHPALLPRHGGQGMYGKRVHQAVFDAGDTISGATVHWVNSRYDEGKIIDQQAVTLDSNDSPSTIEQKVRQVEQDLLPVVLSRMSRTTFSPEKTSFVCQK